MSKLQLFALVFLGIVFDLGFTAKSPSDIAAERQREDLAKIKYYNWLLLRHRTAKQVIEKANEELKEKRLKMLQTLIETPAPHNVTLIITEQNYNKLDKMIKPLNKHVMKENETPAAKLLTSHRQPPKIDGEARTNNFVEFQLTKRDYEKLKKFLSPKTVIVKT
ncbi:unnamed protein product [Caenorhabditis bovis]|uniref:SXP/RAL-2 family protein Ani s 5-like cation-binding domain-containing protein n=1 Tax=Caenorhabditis bovis TaxID=2654633 RepID=A0A8S1F0T6_9PELO|nr:unnamed protein product [Caenorhabditis bovis]